MRAVLRVATVVCVTLLLQPAGMTARQEPAAASPRNASYRLSATLSPESHTIAGSGRLTWRNVTRVPATELRFHLYWNAWRNSNSSWMREQLLGRNPRLAERPAADWGWIDVQTIARVMPAGSDNLRARARFVQPDDGNADDETVLAVPLDTPVAPGGTIDLDLAWTSHVPRTFSRTGVLGRYYFIGQWFPKIGVLEDGGWNCHQFHNSTEFFSDFGTYDVSLTVPSGWIVGATGRNAAKTENGNGTSTHRYIEADVHDFAWTTSPDFLDLTRRLDMPGLPPVDVRLLLQPEHASQAERHFTATRVALSSYGSWFGPYRYGHITVVDPATIFNAPAQGESTGGMEYPTLFTAGTRWIAPARGLQPESVTIHEAGHQFWYGIVATNEFEHAWMDEGFNTFSTARAIAEGLPAQYVTVERYFGGLIPWAYPDVPWSRDIDGNRLNAYRAAATWDIQSTPSWRYWPGAASATTYNKTSLWLATLEKYLGWPLVQKILATHFARGGLRHPAPDEFFAIATEVSGQDLTWFFDAMHRSAAVFDYGVAQVTSTPASGRGFTGDGAARQFSPGRERDDFLNVVIVRRLGDGVFPIDVRVTFDDGSSVTERWDGRDPWHAFRYRKASRVSTVEVDPNRVLLLDVNYTNNSWTARPQAAEAAHKWSLRWLTWFQEVLQTYGFFS